MRLEKQLLLDEISDKLNKSHTFILTRYSGLKANGAHDFRSILEKAGAEFEVVRKRVFLKAVEPMGLPITYEALQGHIGVVFARKDAIEATKAIYQYSQDNENTLEVLGGYFDGKMYTAEDVEKLSKLPGMQEMRAQLLATLVAPMTEVLGVMEALITSVMHALENKAQKENETGS